MFKKTIIAGFLMLSMLSIPTITYAEQYYDQYPGIGFLPQDESLSYKRSWDLGAIWHDDSSDGDYDCPVNFNVPDGSVYFIKSIGIRYIDNLTTGHINVILFRKNLYTGAVHTIAYWTSGTLNASSSEQTYSQGTETGYKLVDTKKFSYWLNIQFIVSGEVNPSDQLRLYQIRTHYGT